MRLLRSQGDFIGSKLEKALQKCGAFFMIENKRISNVKSILCFTVSGEIIA